MKKSESMAMTAVATSKSHELRIKNLIVVEAHTKTFDQELPKQGHYYGHTLH